MPMETRRKRERANHSGSSFDNLLGICAILLTATVLIALQPACVSSSNVPSSFRRQTVSNRENFHWDWKESQELKADRSLRNANLGEQDRKAVARATADEIRPMMADVDIKSEAELKKKALDTRIALIDLNGDGIPEVVAQAMVGCGATGNCPFWVFRKTKRGYDMVLEGEAQTFTVQASSTNGFRDIVLSTHGSYSSGGLTDYHYRDGVYKDVGCYGYEWTVLEGETIRELKEPRITPCRLLESETSDDRKKRSTCTAQ
jgi:hypothetical protein